MSGLHLAERVAIVTGGARGIGRDSALAFAATGASVVVADRAEDGGKETVQLIRNAGGEAAFFRVDVTVEREVAAMVSFATSTFGRLDCAHNNVGGSFRRGTIMDSTEAEWDEVVEINLKAAFLCIKHQLLAMVARGGGAIVNTGSAAGYRGNLGGAPAYTASKHGLIGLIKVAANEGAPRNVRVNVICPGPTLTEAAVEVLGMEALTARGEAIVPLGRLIYGSEVAQAAVWLCSDAASGITGAVVSVDGGMSAV